MSKMLNIIEINTEDNEIFLQLIYPFFLPSKK